MEKKTTTITLRCPPSLKNRVRSFAEQSHRSVSQQVIYMLELGIEAIERGEDNYRAQLIRSGVEDELDSGGLAEW